MRVIYDDLWFCVDCLFAAVNGDMPDDATEEQLAAITEGLNKWGQHLVPAFDSETNDGILEFSRCGCDCCGSPLAGTMHRFAVLGTDEISGEQLETVKAYAARHGRYWKARLRLFWSVAPRPSADETGVEENAVLRTIRNERGIAWLKRFKLPA